MYTFSVVYDCLAIQLQTVTEQLQLTQIFIVSFQILEEAT